jgi:hypothetical protein
VKRSRIKHRKTKQSKQGQAAMKRFKERWKGKPCWNCTSTGRHRHHIVYRDGIQAADDERNLAWLCLACHEAHHQRGLANFFGRRVNDLPTETIINLKRQKDPDYYDPKFLDYLRHPEKYLREHGTMIYQETDNVPTDL